MNIECYKRVYEICLDAFAVMKFDNLSGCSKETINRLKEDQDMRAFNLAAAYCEYKEAIGVKVF